MIRSIVALGIASWLLTGCGTVDATTDEPATTDESIATELVANDADALAGADEPCAAGAIEPDVAENVGLSSEATTSCGEWRWTQENTGFFWGSSTGTCHGSMRYVIPQGYHVCVLDRFMCDGRCWGWVELESNGHVGLMLCAHW